MWAPVLLPSEFTTEYKCPVSHLADSFDPFDEPYLE